MMRQLSLLLLLAAPLPGWAQTDDDAPIPYEDDEDVVDERSRARQHRPRRPREQLREEDEEDQAYEVLTGHLDDPNIGLSAEGLVGAMLLDSSRGALADPRFMGGVRVTWEYGRLLSDEVLREIFFADLTWQVTGTGDGTQQVRADATFHSFTLSPAFAYRFGKLPVAAFVQVGAGLNYTASSLRVGDVATSLDGVKPLFQYGLGLRFRPAILTRKGKETLRLSFRVEVTRFLRGYMHDTFLGGSVGLTF